MTLRAGQTLLHYRLIEQIGEGGMGVVWKATDTRLDRTVALKVLPYHLSDDSKLRERLEREARTVSSLDHPHICTLYDIGRDADVDFIVMEYLEGETLVDCLSRGALPLGQALRYGAEIAQALHEAHRAGVVHRDLKPGNVMITKRGVKLLDFGLAKFVNPPIPAVSTEDAPTATVEAKPITDRGTVLGTVQYMAPEQLEGKEADSRADVFALGSVLHEMITGSRAFSGTSRAGLIAAILTAEPPSASELQPVSPPLLDHLIRKCLAKDPDARWHSAFDLASELEWIEGSDWREAGPPSARRRGRASLWGLAGVALGGLTVGIVMVSRVPQRPPGTPTRFVVEIPSDHRLVLKRWPMGNPASAPVALSPDGSKLVYAASIDDGPSMLYLRELGQLGVIPLVGTEDGRDPFFSPDGAWIGFRTTGALMRLPVGGGSALRITDLNPGGNVAAWGDDGTIVYETGGSVLMRVAATGGELQPVTPRAGIPHLGPQLLPDGRGVLFAGFFPDPRSERQAKAWELAVVPLAGGDPRFLDVPGAVEWGRYLPTGHLVYPTESGLMAVRFDPARLQLVGEPVSVLEDVATYLTFSRNGTLAYVSQDRPHGTLVWVDRDGGATPLQTGDFAYHFPRLSPDGERLTFDAIDEGEIWVHDTTRGTRMRLPAGGGVAQTAWTADGSRIAFMGKTGNIYEMPADGSGKAVPLLERENEQWPMSWSPDGQWLAFTDVDPETGRDIWVLSANGEPLEFLVTPSEEGAAKFSPDGRFIAYQSDESGQPEIYVRPFPGPGGRWLVSTDGGKEPVWSADGTELFYRHGEAMMSVGTTLGESFDASRPSELFRGDFGSDPTGHPMYDVHPDGRRFLMVRQTAAPSPPQIKVVLNWFEELERLVPAQR